MNNKQQAGAIGLDIGGTKIAAGVVLWPSGEILRRIRDLSETRRETEELMDENVHLRQENSWEQRPSSNTSRSFCGMGVSTYRSTYPAKIIMHRNLAER